MLVFITSAMLLAATPSPSAVNEVFQHFYNGQRIIVADVQLCKTVELTNRKRKYDCNETYQGSALKGARVYVYITALVPKLTDHELTVQALWNGTVRTTKDMIFKGPKVVIRSRRFAGFSVPKVGEWTFVVRDGNRVLRTERLTVM